MVRYLTDPVLQLEKLRNECLGILSGRGAAHALLAELKLAPSARFYVEELRVKSRPLPDFLLGGNAAHYEAVRWTAGEMPTELYLRVYAEMEEAGLRPELTDPQHYRRLRKANKLRMQRNLMRQMHDQCRKEIMQERQKAFDTHQNDMLGR